MIIDLYKPVIKNSPCRIIEPFKIANLDSIGALIRASLIIIAPGAILSAMLEFFGIPIFHPIVSHWPFSNIILKTVFGYLDILIFGPIIESALIFLPILILRKCHCRPILAASISSILWAVLHFNGNNIIPSVMAIWPFFCFSLPAFESTRKNRTKTWLKISVIHSFCNLIMVCMNQAILTIREP